MFPKSLKIFFILSSFIPSPESFTITLSNYVYSLYVKEILIPPIYVYLIALLTRVNTINKNFLESPINQL